MDKIYTTEDIIHFLEGKGNEKEAHTFWQAAATQHRLFVDMLAIEILFSKRKKQEHRKFLQRLKKFDAKLPPILPLEKPSL